MNTIIIMDKNELELAVAEKLSTYQLAERFQTSQTNVSYWLRKYDLNTFLSLENKKFKDSLNGNQCKFCGEILTGNKKKFCDGNCKTKYYYHNQEKKSNGNTCERQNRIAKERKLKLIEMSGGCCKLCRYNKNYSALTFHHLNPENKTFCLDARKLSNTSWESILKEWAKCDLLCSNCHAEIHNPNSLLIGPSSGI